MSKTGFPAKFGTLEPFSDRFEAFRLAAEGCDVLFATYPAGTVIETHTHETTNVGVITQGTMIITIGGEERRYGVGDWYEVAAGTPHSARTEEDTSEIEFWFHD